MATDTDTTTISRRAIFGGAGKIAIAGALATMPMVASATAGPSGLEAALDRHGAERASIIARSKADTLSDAEGDAYYERGEVLYDRIEALPATSENVRIKVKAVRDIYDDKIEDFSSDADTTDHRLVRQILIALAAN